MTAAALVGSGEQFLLGTAKGKLFLFDVDKGKQVHDLEGHAHPILAGLHVSRDGRRAMTACQGGKLIAWDLEGGKKLEESDISNGTVKPWTIAFQADGRRAVVGYASVTVGLLQIDTKGKAKLAATHDKHGDRIVSVAMAADGARALSAAEEALWCWELPKE
ncbi:MAG: hypothetical protein K2W96_15340 [Gemmataceae bacterium]|nr:hypothetical protein [Gemmataceae bacterium]